MRPDQYTPRCAQRVHISRNDLTEEFDNARRHIINWNFHKLHCSMRHEWGVYLRSNLDGDWDTASCLRSLFAIPDRVLSPTAPIATLDLDAVEADMWNVTTDSNLPKKIGVAYKSATGGTKHKMLMSCPSSEVVVSTGELEQVDRAKGKTLTTMPEAQSLRQAQRSRGSTRSYRAQEQRCITNARN